MLWEDRLLSYLNTCPVGATMHELVHLLQKDRTWIGKLLAPTKTQFMQTNQIGVIYLQNKNEKMPYYYSEVRFPTLDALKLALVHIDVLKLFRGELR